MENYFNDLIKKTNFKYYLINSLNSIEKMTETTTLSLTRDDYDQIGKALAKNSIWMVLSDATTLTFGNSNYATTYGELTRIGMEQMFRGYNTTGKTYVDLGSGLGKTPLYGVMDHKFKYAVGIELAKERHDQAINMKSKLPEKIKPMLDYFNNDIFKFNISNFDFIFVSNLCFNEDTNKILADKIATETKDNTYIFVSKEISHPKIKILDRRYVKMTWKSDSNIYVYIKLTN